MTRTVNRQLASLSAGNAALRVLDRIANDPMTKAIERLTNDPFMKARDRLANDPLAKAMERWTNDPFAKALERMADDPLTKTLERWTNDPFAKALERMANDPLAKAMERWNNDPFAKALERMEYDPLTKAMERWESDPLAKMAKQFLTDPVARVVSSATGSYPLRLLNASRVELGLAEEISSTIAHLESACVEEPDRAFELFQKLLALVADALVRAKSRLSKRAILNTVLWLIPMLYAYHSSLQTEAQHEAIVQGMEELMALHEQQLEQERQITIYVVKRAVPLSKERKYSGEFEKVLMPGEELELVGRAGKWVKVRVYDHISDSEMEGWVLKKYLTLVQ